MIVYFLECRSPLGMADRSIKDWQITTSGVIKGNSSYGWQARLKQDIPQWGGWCLDNSGGKKDEKNYDQYIQIDLLSLTKVAGIATQGRECLGGEYVRDYKIFYRRDGEAWDFYGEVSSIEILKFKLAGTYPCKPRYVIIRT